ncbi:hypothetical protein HZH66_009203 [Vespula vulgaris]|uniref:Peptidase C51 domain-containing protein n=2 Tax=Vespula TaxID=7451 RepID=A0A834U4C6_VESPE|nr:hypothetical protein HZH66_009203 [Vespula vulgaris]KAF7416509.1 hypothetical protein H0235_011040 [Vespula pensylvanica]
MRGHTLGATWPAVVDVAAAVYSSLTLSITIRVIEPQGRDVNVTCANSAGTVAGHYGLVLSFRAGAELSVTRSN